MGKNDGSVAGVRYFRCEARHGIFVPPARVQRLLLLFSCVTVVGFGVVVLVCVVVVLVCVVLVLLVLLCWFCWCCCFWFCVVLLLMTLRFILFFIII